MITLVAKTTQQSAIWENMQMDQTLASKKHLGITLFSKPIKIIKLPCPTFFCSIASDLHTARLSDCP